MFTEVTDYCRLYLLRHPELDPGLGGTAIGGGPATLSRRGLSQVDAWLKLFGALGLDEVYAPDQPQCLEPATALAASKEFEVKVSAQLRDQDLGKWQGRQWSELLKEDPEQMQDFFQRFGEVAPPEGEHLGQSVDRVLTWWHGLREGRAGKGIAVVMAGGLISGFAAAMLGMRLNRCVSLNLPHGGIGVMDIFANGARIACWNGTALGAREDLAALS